MHKELQCIDVVFFNLRNVCNFNNFFVLFIYVIYFAGTFQYWWKGNRNLAYGITEYKNT